MKAAFLLRGAAGARARRVWLVALAACPLAALAQAPDPAEVAAPALKVGERWVYRMSGRGAAFDRTEVEITAVDEQLVHTVYSGEEGKELDVSFTPEWNAIVDPRGAIFRPHNGRFRFPLRVGDKRSHQAEIEFTRDNPMRVRLSNSIHVEGWEDVEVPAGRFRALRITSDGLSRRADGKGEAVRTRTDFWYAPAAKRWVKAVFHFPKGTVTEELIEYSLK